MKRSFKNLSEFKEQVSQSTEYLDTIKENPEEFINSITFDSPIRIPWVFAFVAGLIGIVGLTSVLFIGYTSLSEPHQLVETLSDGTKKTNILVRQVPEILGVIATSAITAIAGILVPSPLNNNNQ